MKRLLSIILVMIMLLSSSVNMTANAGEEESIGGEEIATAGEVEVIGGEEVVAAEKIEEDIIDTETAEVPSVVTEKGMQFRIENLQDVKSIRYAYGEYETEKDIKYGEDSVSHSAKTLRTRGNSCVLQFPKPGLVSIVITYNDGTRDFHKYEVIKSSPTVTRDGGNDITFGNLSDLKVLRYVKGEFENSYDIKRANGSVAISGKNINSDTYTATLERETYTFCVQYNDESYNYYVTGICGDNLTWFYDMQTATLTVSGEGEMDEHDYRKYPWSVYSDVAEKLVISENITTISEAAFFNFEKLVDLKLPLTLESIDYSVFDRCNSLKSIIIPDNVTWIGGAFTGCENLESVVIGNGVETISSCAFADCSKLKNVIFGSNVNFIGNEAFRGCTSLNDIDLPDSLEAIDMMVFYDTGYYNNKDNWDGEVLYLENHLLNAAYEIPIGTLIIKDGTKSIASCAFEDALIDVVYIPETVKYIGSYAFATKNHGYGGLLGDTIFAVVKGSYAEEYIIQENESIIYDYEYCYFNPADIYG